jgi:NADH:ubiquinone oxidoreductase subunit H
VLDTYRYIFKYIFNGLIVFVVTFVKVICLFVIFILIIATVTLIERKVLALVQRRVGPNYTGYKGRLQFISDAVKFLIKHINMLNYTNRIMFVMLPSFVIVLSFLFWVNVI